MGSLKYLFFHPEAKKLNDFEGGFEDFWPWICERIRQYKWDGPTSWTVQTFYRLKRAGLDAELTDDLTRDGIIVGHLHLLPPRCKPSRSSILICIKPDKFLMSKFAHIHVVQNESDSPVDGVLPIVVAGKSPGGQELVLEGGTVEVQPGDLLRVQSDGAGSVAGAAVACFVIY